MTHSLADAMLRGLQDTFRGRSRDLLMAGERVDGTWVAAPKVEIRDNSRFGPKWRGFSVTVNDLVVWTGADPRDIPVEKRIELLEYIVAYGPNISLGRMIGILA